MEFLKKLYREEEAQGMTEYALILAAVVGAIYGAVQFTTFGTALKGAFSTVASKLTSAIS